MRKIDAPATDQAGEPMAWLYRRWDQTIALFTPDAYPEGGFTVTPLFAALDTQPATGRTMGGEDGA